MGQVRAARTRKCSACTALEKITNTFLWLVSAGDVRPISRFFLSQLSIGSNCRPAKRAVPYGNCIPPNPSTTTCVCCVCFTCIATPHPPLDFPGAKGSRYVYALSNIYPKHSVIFSWKPCQLRTKIQSVIMCVSIIFFTRFRTKKILESEEGTGDGKMSSQGPPHILSRASWLRFLELVIPSEPEENIFTLNTYVQHLSP